MDALTESFTGESNVLSMSENLFASRKVEEERGLAEIHSRDNIFTIIFFLLLLFKMNNLILRSVKKKD